MEPAPTCAFPLIGIFSECFNWALGVLNRLPPSPSVFQLGGNSLGIFQLSPTQYLDPGWVFPPVFSLPTPTQDLTEREQVPAMPHEIKIQDLNQYGRSEDQERLTQICLELLRKQMAQGAYAGTMALISHRVQQRRDICSVSLRVGHQNFWQKKNIYIYSQNLKVESYFIWWE